LNLLNDAFTVHSRWSNLKRFLFSVQSIRRPAARSCSFCLVGCQLQADHNLLQHLQSQHYQLTMSASDEEAELALLEEIEKSQGG
jgi:hypothetical protein